MITSDDIVTACNVAGFDTPEKLASFLGVARKIIDVQKATIRAEQSAAAVKTASDAALAIAQGDADALAVAQAAMAQAVAASMAM